MLHFFPEEIQNTHVFIFFFLSSFGINPIILVKKYWLSYEEMHFINSLIKGLKNIIKTSLNPFYKLLAFLYKRNKILKYAYFLYKLFYLIMKICHTLSHMGLRAWLHAKISFAIRGT